MHSLLRNEPFLTLHGRLRRTRIVPADVEALRLAGWSDLQIAETIHVTALFASFNRVVNGFGLPSQDLLSIYENESDHHD